MFEFKNSIDTLPAERQQKTREGLVKQWEAKLKLMRILREKKALMLIGADNGAYQISGIWGLLQEMQHFSATGYSNFDILKIATYNGALYFDRAETLGVVQKGAKADLLLLEGNPLQDLKNLKKLSGVFKSGIFLDKKTLEAGLKGLVY
ncbi:MAG: amidohydrolase family protein [Saprospiraceae bacterium]|nr:amidohydrolase family protein [Saprospiraceae bacterium]